MKRKVRHIQPRQKNSERQSKNTDHAQKRCERSALVIVFPRMKIFDQQKRNGERNRRTVYDHRHASFEQFGSNHVRLFRRAHLRKNGARPFFQTGHQKMAVRYRVGIQAFDAPYHLLHQFFFGNAAQIQHGHRRVAFASYLKFFHRQFFGTQSLLHQRDIRFEIFDKPFARTAHHRFGRRLGNGALIPLPRVDRDAPARSV